MYQVNFSEQSMSELNKLDMLEQMHLVEQIGRLTHDQLSNPEEPLGKFIRGGKTYYRLRAGDFRCYFELQGRTIYNHYFLHRNTLTDFLFRAKLPVTEEQLAEQQTSFWKYLEGLAKKKK